MTELTENEKEKPTLTYGQAFKHYLQVGREGLSEEEIGILKTSIPPAPELENMSHKGILIPMQLIKLITDRKATIIVDKDGYTPYFFEDPVLVSVTVLRYIEHYMQAHYPEQIGEKNPLIIKMLPSSIHNVIPPLTVLVEIYLYGKVYGIVVEDKDWDDPITLIEFIENYDRETIANDIQDMIRKESEAITVETAETAGIGEHHHE